MGMWVLEKSGGWGVEQAVVSPAFSGLFLPLFPYQQRMPRCMSAPLVEISIVIS